MVYGPKIIGLLESFSIMTFIRKAKQLPHIIHMKQKQPYLVHNSQAKNGKSVKRGPGKKSVQSVPIFSTNLCWMWQQIPEPY